MRTRHTRISHTKVATRGDAYTRTWIGVPVVYTTWDGERLAGVIDRFQDVYPVVVFPDGRWARLNSHVEVITAP